MNTAKIEFGYNAGPPLVAWPNVGICHHWNTLKPECFPRYPATGWSLLRLWDDGTSMPMWAPAPGQYNWVTIDQRIAAAQAHGVQIIMVLGGHTPAWMAIPFSGSTIESSAPDPVLAQPAIAAFVTRYKGQIAAYETYNEYNAINFYSGSKAQLIAWQKMVYATVKSIDAAALVTSPTPCWNATTVEQELDWICSTDMRWDVFAFHGYEKAGLPGDAIRITLQNCLAVMARYGRTNPMWMTEGGFSGSANGDQLFTAAEQYQWTILFYLSMLTFGVQVIAWYGWDYYTNPHNQCITDATGKVLTPAGQAIADLYTRLF